MPFFPDSLQSRFLTILAAMLMTVIGIMAWILYQLMVSNLQQQEHQTMLNAAWQLHQEIDREVADLSALTQQWASSDNFRRYMRDGISFPRGLENTFRTGRVDIMILTDSSGNLLLSAGNNPFEPGYTLCEDLSSVCSWIQQRIESFTGQHSQRDILVEPASAGLGHLPDIGYFMISSRSIQGGDSWHTLGRLTLVRFLSGSHLRLGHPEQEESDPVVFRLSTVSNDFFDKDPLAVSATPVDSYTQRIQLRRASVLPNQLITLTTYLPRYSFHDSMTVFQLTLAGTALMLMLVMLATLYVFRRMILHPITHLGGYARRLRDSIGEQLEAPPCWLQARNDELGLMAREFQHLIQALNQSNEHLRELTQRDALTDLGNRRQLDRQLPRTLSLTHRLERPVALVMIDVDHFKLYNDHYGHPQGDRCLKAIADTLRDIFQRDSDLIARIGGEEFVIVLPNFDEYEALNIARGLCTAIEAQCIPHAHSPTHRFVTISAGVAVSTPESPLSGEALLKRADEALYEIKKNGRNAVGSSFSGEAGSDEVEVLFALHGDKGP